MNRYKSVKIASILGIIGNIFLLIIKAIIGFISNSQAMIAESFNSFGDILSSILTFIGNKIASNEADEDHNLGHGKAEYIFSLLISVVMMFVAFKLLYSSVTSLFSDYNYKFSYFLIIVPIITLIVKLSLYIYTHRIAKKFKNLLIEANANDHRNDCLLAILNLISAIFGLYNITYIDGIVGSFISIWIFIVGVKIFIEAYDVLMDKSMDDDTKDKILEIVKHYKEIKKINHLNSTPVGYKYQISLTIFVDGNLSTFESHEIANKLEKEIASLDNIYLAVIHVNPI